MMIDFTLRRQELIMAESTNIGVGFSGQKKMRITAVHPVCVCVRTDSSLIDWVGDWPIVWRWGAERH